MYVIGATNEQEFRSIRKIIPDHFLLVPGIGAQGGDLNQVIKNGMNNDVGLLVNSSRGILYASIDESFQERAHEEAKKIQIQMAEFL